MKLKDFFKKLTYRLLLLKYLVNISEETFILIVVTYERILTYKNRNQTIPAA